MASVNSLVLIDENVATSAAGDTKSVEIGHSNFLGHLVVSNWNATTLDINIEHSPDGTNWYVLKSFAQASGNGTQLVQISDSNVNVLGNVRMISTIVGTDADVKVTLWYDRHK